MPQQTRIAVMRLSALGDLVLMLPLINRLVQAGIEPHWIISKTFAPLFRAVPGVRLLEIDKPQTLADYRQLYRLLGQHSYEVLLATQANLRVNLLYPAIRAKRKLGFDRARARDGQGWFVNESISAQQNHLCQGFLQFADHLGVADCPLSWQLPVDDAAKYWAQQRLGSGSWLAINPAASKAERNWPGARYVELIQALLQQGRWSVVLIGGPAASERALAETISQQLPAGAVLNLVGQTQLTQLVALLSQVDALVAPDTGPVHIANALAKPVVGLYAVAPSWLTGPVGQSQYVVDKYPQALREFMGKEATQVPIGTRVHHPQAMSLISVDEVWQKLLLLH